MGPKYDPWYDINDDGIIDMKDVGSVAGAFGTSGDPTKNVTITNWPEWWPSGEVNVTNWPPVMYVNVTNFPLDEEGNIRVNFTCCSSDQTNLTEPTTEKIAIYEISGDTSSTSYTKVAELVVPSGEKWYVYKMRFAFGLDWSAGRIRLIVAGVIMMDEVSSGHLALTSTNKGESGAVLELKRPLELIEGERVELWIRYTGSNPSGASNHLIVEAWVAEI